MEIAKNKVVGMDYTLTNNEGTVIDTSKNQGPLFFIFGLGHIIPGLENALTGKKKGDSLKVSIQPKDGYGEREDELVQAVPRAQFDAPEGIEIGMQFEVQTEQGGLVVTVTELTDEHVTVDGNHPLAGEVLNFDVSIVDVREATAEEMAHGHVHGPGGHHH
ncbi:MAG: peptidylprolyl isomerase [Bdellovibrio sp. CG12_big_fil_rev_8_21_14_0_65_39_13]|nr:MAG: peptidylprolyl isomerase [Bdellovibrio sp. CG22_combo_CG10-13_8_21_14_all_39_27]PIQ61148.1 MAG: peptidylprolyl isomerase [Bdellovibrio sp. CG12_big_fil_rev_8_21_14_0_65_39_13]PIR34820.1 MAG: peptidylprolyl isomerase [Bdellovibrio sp. CG11_big_fil_rev_8_21_14_0_20_39_38]